MVAGQDTIRQTVDIILEFLDEDMAEFILEEIRKRVDGGASFNETIIGMVDKLKARTSA